MSMADQEGGRESRPWRATEALLLGLMIALAAVPYVVGYYGDGYLDSLSQLTERMEPDYPLISGGGPAYNLLHHWVNAAGLSYLAFYPLYFVLDVASLLAWLLLGRRLLPDAVLWCSALWLVFPATPREVLENSTVAGFVAAPLLLCLLHAARGSVRAGVTAAALFWLCVDLSLGAAFVLPAALAMLWLGGAAPDRNERAVGPRLAVAGLLVLAVAAPVLMQTSDQGASEFPSELGFRFQRELIAQTVVAIGRFLLSYLQDPALLVGAVALVAAWARRPLPYARECGLWLVFALVPVAVVDQFHEEYHFMMAIPARALIGGAGLAWLIEIVGRRAKGRLSWRAGVACITAALIFPAWLGVAGSPQYGPKDAADHCADWEESCSVERMRRFREGILGAGLVSSSTADVTFYGVDRHCLDADWRWRRHQAPGHVAPSAPPEALLLLQPRPGLELVTPAAAPVVEGLVAAPGVRPLRHELRTVEDGPPPVFELAIHGLGEGLAYVGVSSSWNFAPGEIVAGGGAPLVRCDHPHVDGYYRRFDGYLIVRGDGSDPYRVTFEDTDRHAQPPESITVLLLP